MALDCSDFFDALVAVHENKGFIIYTINVSGLCGIIYFSKNVLP